MFYIQWWRELMGCDGAYPKKTAPGPNPLPAKNPLRPLFRPSLNHWQGLRQQNILGAGWRQKFQIFGKLE